MKILRLVLLLTAHCLLVTAFLGCCSYPQGFQKARNTLGLVQSFYDPLVSQLVSESTDAKIIAAVVAADAALALAGGVQDQWCPDPAQVQQAAAQAQKAQGLAAQAGVAEAK